MTPLFMLTCGHCRRDTPEQEIVYNPIAQADLCDACDERQRAAETPASGQAPTPPVILTQP
jgi:hypothetical protein